mmetsp:Transcript_59477/g.181526  ORF Transcript_59477/g.181526 Transcript_59477/m.181526 type:complete len:201 (+) Transcript_59477:961-1563(+)
MLTGSRSAKGDCSSPLVKAAAKQSMKSRRTPPMSKPSSPTNCTRKPKHRRAFSSAPCTSRALMPSSRCSTQRSATCTSADRTMSARRTTMGAAASSMTSAMESSLTFPSSSQMRFWKSWARWAASFASSASRCCCAAAASRAPRREPDKLRKSSTGPAAARTKSRVPRDARTLCHKEDNSILPKYSTTRCRALAISSRPL